jgi:hypothetical protein
VPAPPVAPRGDGQREAFIVLALVSLVIGLAGLAGFIKTRQSHGER